MGVVRLARLMSHDAGSICECVFECFWVLFSAALECFVQKVYSFMRFFCVWPSPAAVYQPINPRGHLVCIIPVCTTTTKTKNLQRRVLVVLSFVFTPPTQTRAQSTVRHAHTFTSDAHAHSISLFRIAGTRD